MFDFKKVLNKLKNMQTEVVTNSNGTAVKFADGTMICYGKLSLSNVEFASAGAIYYSAYQTITFPASFVGNVSTNISAMTGNLAWIGNIASTTSKCTYVVLHSTDVKRGVNIEWQAIGRWK